MINTILTFHFDREKDKDLFEKYEPLAMLLCTGTEDPEVKNFNNQLKTFNDSVLRGKQYRVIIEPI